MLAIICVIPYALVLQYDETNGCYEQWPMESLNIAYTLSLTTVQYFIPVTVLSFIYVEICKKLIARNNWIHRLNVRCENWQENGCRIITWFQSIKFRTAKTFIVSLTTVTSFVIAECPIQVAWVVSVISSTKIISHIWFEALMYEALDSKVFFPCRHSRSPII